jgi:Cu+-exporting ATPase
MNMQSKVTATAPAGPAAPLVLDILGMHCAGCAGAVERALASVAGPEHVKVHLALERAEVTAGDPAALVAAVEKAGYGAVARTGDVRERHLAADRAEAERRAGDRRMQIRLIIAALFTLPFLVDMAQAAFSGGHMLNPHVQLALATVVQFGCGWPFLAGAVRSLRLLRPNMDVLVALGTLAAFGLSLFHVLQEGAHAHALYFEASAAIITFVLLGKVIEASARAGAGAVLTALAAERPEKATVLRDNTWVDVPAESIRPGERFALRAGDKAPADGLVVEGRSAMDEALVTGESLPVSKQPGARIIAGSVNGEGTLVVEASAVGEDTTLARIARLVETAQVSRAPIQRLVDRVSAIFVPAVLVLALIAGLVWFFALGADMDRAITIAVSVLVIACPCALGLATPLALVAGTGRAAKEGIIIRDIGAIERAAEVDTVVFDKTGTVTEGTPEVAAIAAPGIGSDEALAMAAAVSQLGNHPFSRALVKAAEDRGLDLPVASDVATIPGAGVSGRAGARAVVLGHADFLRERGIQLGAIAQMVQHDAAFGTAQSVSWLAVDGRVVASFAFADRLRGHARQAVAALKPGVQRTLLLSGDRTEVAEAIGAEIGVDAAKGRLKPDEKVREIKALGAAGQKVAMVGDGLNDTAALMAAQVGISMAGAAGSTEAAADITLMRPDLRLVSRALAVARQTRGTIRQNLLLAFLFNGLGIPLAMAGQLTPAVAGAAMALSSVTVVLNALRLARSGLPRTVQEA